MNRKPKRTLALKDLAQFLHALGVLLRALYPFVALACAISFFS